ncbi:hypothetical protein OKA05_20815 [Luteolibacter arcticus]|uniref:HEAT repeat domain-containing protein n=1 Tax=Luteolibacter arcticus TaxID=1581411 RepID=A0ABT3GND7_9BACT|nr:hypothetical protein [Luteolibacter arcticus]MCW1925017.1 hypothetical protein [Luteolibacter arcticus]
MNPRSIPLLPVLAAALLLAVLAAGWLFHRGSAVASDEVPGGGIHSPRRATEQSNKTVRLKGAGIGQHLATLSAEEALLELQPLAERDRAAAFEQALALALHPGSEELARGVLRGLIGADLPATIAWAESRGPSPEMELFWAAAIDLTAGPDPARAFELSHHVHGDLRRSLLEEIFAEWAGEDPESAKRAAGSLASDEERLAALRVVLASELDRDLEATIAWIESVGDLELQDGLYYQAVRHWAARDPSGAADFADSLVESDYKTHVAGRLLESWVRSDADAAMAWASQLPDQESREEAISRGIRLAFEGSPEQAADVALRLPGEGDRAAALELVVSAWVEQDPTALEKWVDDVPDANARARILQMIQDHLTPAR